MLRIFYFKNTKASLKKTHKNRNHATIVTYFPNIDNKKAEKNIFWSNYWNDLHSVLGEMSIPINWVLLNTKSDTIKLKEAITLRNSFNKEGKTKNSFFFIDEFLTISIFFKVCMAYIKLFLKGLKLQFVRKNFQLPGSSINFFPFLEHEWKSSFFGKDALESLFFAYAFDSMALKLSADPWGLFIWENQRWEQGLISAWKRNGAKRIIGSQHATLKPFNLRAICDPRIYADTDKYIFHIPDILAVNGEGARSFMLNAKFPEDHLKEAEALRYMDLLDIKKFKNNNLNPSNRTLLVITGLFHSDNLFQLSLLRDAAAIGGLDLYKKILIKPHPFLSIPDLLEDLNLDFDYEVTDNPLKELWQNIDVAYCANITSGSVEAAWLGVPVIVAGPSENFNSNPLYQTKGNKFIMDPLSLFQALKTPDFAKIQSNFFYLDRELNRWKSLLKN